LIEEYIVIKMNNYSIDKLYLDRYATLAMTGDYLASASITSHSTVPSSLPISLSGFGAASDGAA